MELYERPIPINIHYLNEMKYNEYKPFLNKCKNEEERKRNFDIMKSFCATNIKTNFETKRVYAYTEGGYGGRLFCGNSIQSIPKPVRGFVFSNTTDIDQCRSHPTILKYICKLNNIECPILTYYIDNYYEIISRFGESGKMLFLCAINTETLNKKVKDEFFVKFDKECKMIHKKIVELEQYKDIVDRVYSIKTHNWMGSVINRILCLYENQITQEALSVVIEKNIEVASIMFDGFMIYGNYYNDNDLLQEITDRVNNKFEGLNMKWSYKEHDTTIKLPEDYEIPLSKKEILENKIKNDEFKIADNDLEASNIIYDEIKNIIVYSKSRHYFKQNNIWITDIKNIKGCLVMYIMNSKIYRVNDKNELINFVQNRKSAVNIYECVMDKAIESKNDDWFNNIFNSSLGYILFNNGYYDFKNSKFINCNDSDFDNSIIFMEKINYDYDVFDDEEYIDEIKQKLFYDPFGVEVGDYYILNFSRGLAGDCMKRCLFGIGDSNTGKSILTSILKSCADGYIGDFNAVNLVYKKSNNDEAQNLRWVMLLQFKRIIISNELQLGYDIDGNMLKKISNGGLDAITARGHGEGETSFKIPFLPIVFANDINNIKPKDDAVMNRVKAIHYSKVFVEHEPTNIYELQKDENLKDEINTLKFKLAFINILFRSYKSFVDNDYKENEPSGIVKMKQDILGEEESAINILKQDFEITNNEEDFITSEDLQDWLISKKISKTMTKFGLEINKHATINNLKFVYNKYKKIKGKTKKCWFGIKEIV